MSGIVDNNLSEHMEICKINACPCKAFAKYYASKDGQDDCRLENGDVWLWYALRDQPSKNCVFPFGLNALDNAPPAQVLEWRCLVCEHVHGLQENPQRQSHEFRTSNVRRHAQSCRHLQALKSLGLTQDLICPDADPLPPSKESFAALLSAVQGGIAQGKDGLRVEGEILGRKKSECMLWSLGEALLRRKQAKLRNARVLCIMRDERLGRLHLRFRCVDGSLDVSQGYLGQHRSFESSSTGINAATRDILIDFCTQWKGVPPHPSSDCELRESVFDEALYSHICKIFEAIAIDSASNEVTAARDCHSVVDNMILQTWQRNDFIYCKFILRDSAHAARRVLSRPWKADEVMSDILGLLCQWKDSLPQLVQHSLDLRRMLHEFQEQTKMDAPTVTPTVLT